MPVTELIRHFNTANHRSDSSLYLDGQRVTAWHCGLKLQSSFQPVVDLQRERIVGHQARLLASAQDGTPVDGETAYALNDSAAAIVHFDRLCRTLHALNFLAQQAYAGGYLQMAIHPRHLQAVPGQHGLVYEAILKRCGLAPQDIVLAIETPTGPDDHHWLTALDSYRQRGYRLALSAPGSIGGMAALLALRPDLLRLDQTSPPAILHAARQTGIAVEMTGIDHGRHLEEARRSAIALGSGRLFGEARADCRPTHSKHRVAYNSPSSFGTPP